MVAATWKVPGMDNVELAEAFGLLNTMRMAHEFGFRKGTFEGDNKRI
jgi:hypothetical protein